MRLRRDWLHKLFSVFLAGASATLACCNPARQPAHPPDAGPDAMMDADANAPDDIPIGISHDHSFADWPMPDAWPGSHTMPSYTVTGPSVVDEVTGLIWQRDMPMIYAGCTGKYSTDSVAGDACSWDEAKRYCADETLGAALGGSGWRLPTKIELESIADETRIDPAIDPDAFPRTRSKAYWTFSPYVGAADRAWTVDFYGAKSRFDPVSDANYVRCVRSP